MFVSEVEQLIAKEQLTNKIIFFMIVSLKKNELAR
jgi:hypothetical protein